VTNFSIYFVNNKDKVIMQRIKKLPNFFIGAKNFAIDMRQSQLPKSLFKDSQLSPFLLFAVIGYIVALLFRSWSNIFHPGLYMEDAGHYFNVYYGGFRDFSYILQHPNGYYNILNNLVAWIAAKIDVRLQPILYHMFSLALGITVATCMAFTGLIRTKAILLVTPLALGLSGMNHIYYHVSLTFQMYNVVVLLLCLFFFRFPNTWTATILMTLLATLLIWSGPYSVVAIPVAFLYLFFFKPDKKTIWCCSVIFCAFLYTSAVRGGVIQINNILDPGIQQGILSVLFGKIFFLNLLGKVNGIHISLISLGIVCLVFSLRQNFLYIKISALLFTMIILSLAPLFLSQKIQLYQAVFPCHIYISQFFWIFFLLFSLDTVLQKQIRYRKTLGIASAVLVATVVLFDNVQHPYKGFRTIMTTVPEFVHTIHLAEQLQLETNNQYIVLQTQNIVPGAPPPTVRVGSRQADARRVPAEHIPLFSGKEFIVDQ
jgi:hypothetical protein